MRPGRHGSMSSSELESIIARNGDFISVRRAGSGDGYAGVYNNVTGEFIMAINGGQLPEFSRMKNLKKYCDCNPKGLCRTGAHGTDLLRGWRNALYELMARKRLRITKEIKRTLGTHATYQAYDYGMGAAPMHDTAPAWEYSGI